MVLLPSLWVLEPLCCIRLLDTQYMPHVGTAYRHDLFYHWAMAGYDPLVCVPDLQPYGLKPVNRHPYLRYQIRHFLNRPLCCMPHV